MTHLLINHCMPAGPQIPELVSAVARTKQRVAAGMPLQLANPVSIRQLRFAAGELSDHCWFAAFLPVADSVPRGDAWRSVPSTACCACFTVCWHGCAGRRSAGCTSRRPAASTSRCQWRAAWAPACSSSHADAALQRSCAAEEPQRGDPQAARTSRAFQGGEDALPAGVGARRMAGQQLPSGDESRAASRAATCSRCFQLEAHSPWSVKSRPGRFPGPASVAAARQLSKLAFPGLVVHEKMTSCACIQCATQTAAKAGQCGRQSRRSAGPSWACGQQFLRGPLMASGQRQSAVLAARLSCRSR